MTIVSEVLDMTHSIWNYVSKRVLPSRTAEIDNELRYSTLVTLKFMAREGSLTSITTFTTNWHLARHIPYAYLVFNKHQDDRIKQRADDLCAEKLCTVQDPTIYLQLPQHESRLEPR
jgi:hypothetical protein